MRKSPIDGTPLRRETRHGIEIDVGDHGLWLDKGELLLLTEAERHTQPGFEWGDLLRKEQNPPVDRERHLRCPVCDHPMEIEDLHGVALDWCRDHGVWLDSGELEAMLNNLRLDPLFVGKVAIRLWEGKF